MNILPKKSWHVRNKDNVERVRRDEEDARKEEKEKERRAALAEQEARTALLRDRATKKLVKGGKSHDPTMVLADSKPKHLNFFADIEEGLRSGSNSEYEAEKKAEQEKREKAIGVLTYLGQSLKDTESEKPWYVKSHKHRMVDPVAGRESAKEKDRKESLDPLNEMKKYLEIKKSHKEDKGKKHKIAGKDSSRQKQSIKEMRRERLRREQEEREKERRLLANIGKEKHSAAIKRPNYDAPQRYNSQYNPEFARRPRDDSRYRPF